MPVAQSHQAIGDILTPHLEEPEWALIVWEHATLKRVPIRLQIITYPFADAVQQSPNTKPLRFFFITLPLHIRKTLDALQSPQ